VPDVYRRCDPACDQPADTLDLMNVTSVKLYIIARSREATPGYTDTKTYVAGAAGNVGPFNDGFKRHLYSTTVRLPNVSGRRERP
jgi:type IV pilus assembly protein PilW